MAPTTRSASARQRSQPNGQQPDAAQQPDAQQRDDQQPDVQQPEAVQPDALTLAIEDLQRADAIRLVIPDSTPRAHSWAPHGSSPSIVLSRVRLPFVAADVPIPPPAVTEDVREIVLDKYLGRHHYAAMTDTYRASVRGSVPTPGLIVKMVDLTMGDGPVAQEADRLAKMVKTWQVTVPLQGTILPRLAGPFGNGTLFCFVFEDAGRNLTRDELVQESVRTEIRNAMDAVYDAGVAISVTDGTGDTYFVRGRDGRVKVAHLSDSNILDDINWRNFESEAEGRRRKREKKHCLLDENYLRLWEYIAKRDAEKA